MLANLRGNFSAESKKRGERNGADECPTIDGYRPHHQLTHVEKEQTRN
jgi:hypothetical protein